LRSGVLTSTVTLFALLAIPACGGGGEATKTVTVLAQTTTGQEGGVDYAAAAEEAKDLLADLDDAQYEVSGDVLASPRAYLSPQGQEAFDELTGLLDNDGGKITESEYDRAAAAMTTLQAELDAGLAPPVANPDGRIESVCDYLLGNFTETRRGYRFVADATVRNTGNVGIVVKLTGTWDQIGGAPVKVVKTVSVPTEGRKIVHLLRVASSDEIDRHQSANSRCNVKATIIDSFGEAQ
jgi:hypothetical protein